MATYKKFRFAAHPEDVDGFIEGPYRGTIKGYHYVKKRPQATRKSDGKKILGNTQAGYFRKKTGTIWYKDKCSAYKGANGKVYRCSTGSKRQLWNETSHHMKSGSTRDQLDQNENGRIVWAKKSEHSKKVYAKNLAEGKMCPFGPLDPEWKRWIDKRRKLKETAEGRRELEDPNWYTNTGRMLPPPPKKKRMSVDARISASSPSRFSPRRKRVGTPRP